MRIFQSEKIMHRGIQEQKPTSLNVKQFREKYMHVCTHMYIALYFQFYFSKLKLTPNQNSIRNKK